MQETALAFLLLFSTFAWAAGDPNPAEYAVDVSSSQVDRNGTYHGTQGLRVVIDGKKYELRSEVAINRVLALGDYKAKLVQDERKTTYDSVQVCRHAPRHHVPVPPAALERRPGILHASSCPRRTTLIWPRFDSVG
jgi:hypothetical protein